MKRIWVSYLILITVAISFLVVYLTQLPYDDALKDFSLAMFSSITGGIIVGFIFHFSEYIIFLQKKRRIHAHLFEPFLKSLIIFFQKKYKDDSKYINKTVIKAIEDIFGQIWFPYLRVKEVKQEDKILLLNSLNTKIFFMGDYGYILGRGSEYIDKGLLTIRQLTSIDIVDNYIKILKKPGLTPQIACNVFLKSNLQFLQEFKSYRRIVKKKMKRFVKKHKRDFDPDFINLQKWSPFIFR